MLAPAQIEGVTLSSLSGRSGRRVMTDLEAKLERFENPNAN
jgi:hypothetical protein